jgi:hypothetical protein
VVLHNHIRGRPAGYQHNEIIAAIVEAIARKSRKLWYDHIYMPAFPLTLQHQPFRLNHFSPSPDVVMEYHDGSYWMIHVQRVYPYKRHPYKLKTKAEEGEGDG